MNKNTAFGRTQLHPEVKRRIVDPQSPLKVSDIKGIIKREVKVFKVKKVRRWEATVPHEQLVAVAFSSLTPF